MGEGGAGHQSADFQARLRDAGRTQALILAVEFMLATAIAVVVGVLTTSVAWAVVTVVAVGVVLVVLGSVAFASAGGLSWLRHRGQPPS